MSRQTKTSSAGSLLLKTGAGLGAATATLAAYRQWHESKTAAEEGPSDSGPRIVILGAGFAGLTVARTLSTRLRGRASILLVDQHNYHLFTPALYQAATLGVDPYDVAFPVRQLTGRHRMHFRQAKVTGIDFDARRVQFDNGDAEYDYLVVALGTTTNFFGNQAAQEHATPLKWLADGVTTRNHIIDVLERATITADEDERKQLLTFVVVGGGATGVETAGALATLLHNVIPADYPGLSLEDTRVVVIESEGKLLGHMGDKMARIAQHGLEEMGVEIWLNSKAGDVEPDLVKTDDGRSVRARTILWTTGVRVPDVVSSLAAEHGKGGSLAVDEYLRVCGHPEVYAAGDNSHFEDPRTGKSVPLLAAAAVQEGEAVAENIARAIGGSAPAPFHYKDLGNVVSLGRFNGAAQVGPVAFGGLAGWLAWRLIHLVRITSFRNKLATLLDWSIGFASVRDTARIDLAPRRQAT